MDPNAILCAEGIGFSYGSAPVLKGVDFHILPGQFVALIGPNASGKTTLLKILLGQLEPAQGAVWLEGRRLESYPLRERAKRIAYVSQQPAVAFPLTVRELVWLGRYPHSGRFGSSNGDDRAVEEALRLTGSLALAERPFAALSGGEKQKVLLSRALAQTSRLLLMDEPTVHLDVYFQLEVLATLKRMCGEKGLAVTAVLHDLNLVSRFADRVLLLKPGQPPAFGATEEVVREGSIREAFGVEVTAGRDPESGARYFLPRPRSTETKAAPGSRAPSRSPAEGK